MKVYCAAPIRGNVANKQFSDLIPSLVAKLGHTSLNELSVPSVSSLQDTEIFERDIKWLKESSCVIAEVSNPSTGVGFEIAYSLYVLKIPVLALYQNGSSVSAMVKGCNSQLMILKSYNSLSEVEEHITSFIGSF